MKWYLARLLSPEFIACVQMRIKKEFLIRFFCIAALGFAYWWDSETFLTGERRILQTIRGIESCDEKIAEVNVSAKHYSRLNSELWSATYMYIVYCSLDKTVRDRGRLPGTHDFLCQFASFQLLKRMSFCIRFFTKFWCGKGWAYSSLSLFALA